MLSLLEEYEAIERLGTLAKIYNKLKEKNNHFNAQKFAAQRSKKKKISYKTALYLKAGDIAHEFWNAVKEDTGKITVSVNPIVTNLYRLNSESLNRVFGFFESDFEKLMKQTIKGHTLASCNMARRLSEKISEFIDKSYAD